MDRALQGTVLAGKYALVSKLGQGGMGSVWRAEHVQLRSPVAIKLIDHEIVENPEALARFMREAQSAAALRSPHVVQILDFGADAGVPYIAMELLDGESLAARIERTRGMTARETASVITQVSRAIAKAHEAGIVHRDLKPDNIFIVKNDEEEVAKVLDFGIAKATTGFGVTTGSNTRTGAVLGTPYYMSPEQAEGNRHVDHRTDIWALGVIAFECLLGRRPFDSDALGSLLLAICTRPMPVPSNYGHVPPGFDSWFSRACARELGERFQSARELATDLRRVCTVNSDSGVGRDPSGIMSSQTAPAASGTTPYVARPPTANTYSTSVGLQKSRAPVLAMLIGGIVLAAAIAGGVAFFMKQRPSDAEAEAASANPPKADVAAAVAAAPAPSPPVEVAPVPVTAVQPSPAPAVSASTAPASPAAPKATAAVRRPTRPLPAAKEKPPAPAPATAKPAPPPAPKAPSKGVNLGI